MADDTQNLKKAVDILSGNVLGLNIMVATLLRMSVRNSGDRLFLQDALNEIFREIDTNEFADDPSRAAMQEGMNAIRKQGLDLLTMMAADDPPASPFVEKAPESFWQSMWNRGQQEEKQR